MQQIEKDKKIKDFVEHAFWYHTIEFPDGLVSNGLYDHRERMPQYGFPENLNGKTVLDVGAADGFFSFELEKRGGQVTAIDTHSYNGKVGHTDISPSKQADYAQKYDLHRQEAEQFQEICTSFGIDSPNRLLVAKAILGSLVDFRYESIYNLRQWQKKFDLVVCGDLIEHLKDPLGALENLVAVTGNMCVITVSSSIKSPKNRILPKKIYKGLDKLLSYVGLRLAFGNETTLLEYCGNASGGSFFHFYPNTFRDAALASGFRRVEIFTEFDVKSDIRNSTNHHVVFHCYV